MKRWLYRLAAIALALLLAPLMLHLLARQMLYPAPAIRVPSPPPSPLIEVKLELASASAIGWGLENPQADDEAPAVLFFHGNGENLETMRYAGLYQQLIALGVHFLAVDYPGYGRSGGSPNEESLTASGRAGLAWLTERFPLSPKVVLGWSLGAAVAAQTVVPERGAPTPEEVAGLVLISAWDDLRSLGGVHFPKWLVGAALEDRYDSLALVPRIRLPVLMIHGERDSIIPIAHGRRLFEAFGDNARFVAVPGAGHNDLLGRDEVWRELAAFLRGLDRGDG